MSAWTTIIRIFGKHRTVERRPMTLEKIKASDDAFAGMDKAFAATDLAFRHLGKIGGRSR